MIEHLLSLQTFGYFEGGAIGNVLSIWQQAGFFSYAIPFLLIFSIIYGLLTQIKLFGENRVINAIIALSVGLMALQFDFVPRFFSEIFPRLGVGLVILLVILILTSLFTDPEEKWMMYIMWAIGVFIVLVILVQTAGVVGAYSFMPWLVYNWPTVIAVIAFLVLIAVVVGSGRPKSTTHSKSPFAKMLKEAYGD